MKATHQVLDLVYTPDEGQKCFEGTEQECNGFIEQQGGATFTYKVVPIIHKDNMVIINEITEPKCQLFFKDELVGEISSHLQLNDCLLQILRGKLEGYYLLYEGDLYPIRPDGRFLNGGNVYPLFSKQMKEVMGF
jgi:hypothetical protein